MFMYKDKREVQHKLRVLQHAENVDNDVEAAKYVTFVWSRIHAHSTTFQ